MTTFLLSFGFMRLLILELAAGKHRTDKQTERRGPMHNVTSYREGRISGMLIFNAS